MPRPTPCRNTMGVASSGDAAGVPALTKPDAASAASRLWTCHSSNAHGLGHARTPSSAELTV